MAKLLKPYYDFRGGWNCDAAPDNLADNELALADNIDLAERGGLSKRRGTVALNEESYGAQVEQLFEWSRDSGENILMAVIGKTLCTIADDGTKTDVQELASSRIGWFFFKDALYFVDGAEYRVYDGETVQAVQAASPPPAPTLTGKAADSETELKAGTYKGAVVFVDEFGVESEASEEASVTITKGQKITWTNIPQGPEGTMYRRLYRTMVDGTVLRRLATIENNTATTYDDTTADYDLGSAIRSENNLAPIKRCKFIVRHPKSFRIFAAGDSENPTALYFSEPNEPAYFPKTSMLVPTTGDGPITGLALFGDAVMVFYRHSIWIWRGLDPDEDAIWEKLPTGQGTVAERSIALTQNSLTFLGIGGIYAISPAILAYTVTLAPGEELIANLAANRVTNAIRGIVHPEKCCAVYDPYNERYLLAYCDDPAIDRNNRVLVYDWGLHAFTRYTDLYINDFCYRQNGDLLAATDGYIIKMGEGYRDYGDRPIRMLAATKPYTLDYPFHKKRMTRLFVAFRQSEEGICRVDSRIKVDDVAVLELTDATVYDSFIWGDEWGKMWGWRNLVTSRMKISQSGHRVQVEITNSQIDIPTTIYGIAFEYRPIRAKGTRLEN